MTPEDQKAREEFEAKCKRNKRVSARYDELMREGKHGHYETMFRVVREEVEASRRTYRASVLEEAARVAESEPRVWDLSAPDPQTRIAAKIRALAAKTQEGQEPCC